MALSFTLGALVDRCQKRYTGQGDELLDAPELKELIFEYYGEMHALVVEKGARHFEAEDTITATGAATYALPANHLTTVGVDHILSGTTGPRRAVHGPIAAQERARLMSLVSVTGAARYFGLEGPNIALYPVPSSGTYKHLYVPQPVDLSTAADSTSVDLINIYGYRLVLWGVASVAQHKGSASQQRAVDEHKRASDQLEYWACQRALLQPSYRVQEDDCYDDDDGRYG
jgi:hypothetical protein